MKKNIIILFASILLPILGIASSAATGLWGLKVWEYYKYENGTYRNYAVVINTKDTTIDLVILKPCGFYVRPYTLGPVEVIRDSSGRAIGFNSAPKIYSAISIEDSLRLGQIILKTGDTLLSGIRLKPHEIKIIPNLFEQFRDSNFLYMDNKKLRHLDKVFVLVNGKYGGGYTLNHIAIDDNLPKTGIISCTSMNSGTGMPFYIHLKEREYKAEKSYKVTLYMKSLSRGSDDTLEIKASKNDESLTKFYGLPNIQPLALDLEYPDNTYWKEYLPNAQGENVLIHSKSRPDIVKEDVQLKTPDTAQPSFTGFDVRFYVEKREGMVNSIGYSVLIPMNIKL